MGLHPYSVETVVGLFAAGFGLVMSWLGCLACHDFS
jgi:hypothetical protein